jgi:hypothetical protein
MEGKGEKRWKRARKESRRWNENGQRGGIRGEEVGGGAGEENGEYVRGKWRSKLVPHFRGQSYAFEFRPRLMFVIIQLYIGKGTEVALPKL